MKTLEEMQKRIDDNCNKQNLELNEYYDTILQLVIDNQVKKYNHKYDYIQHYILTFGFDDTQPGTIMFVPKSVSYSTNGWYYYVCQKFNKFIQFL